MTKHFTREEVSQEMLATKATNEWSVWGRWARREGSDGSLFVGMFTVWMIRLTYTPQTNLGQNILAPSAL